MMGDDDGEALQAVPGEDRLEHEDVGQVHAAGIGIVEDEDVAGPDAVGEAVDDDIHRVRHRAEMQRDGLGLAEDPAVAVAERRRIVEHVADDRRARGAHHRPGHVVDDGVERALDDREGDRVDRSRRRAVSA